MHSVSFLVTSSRTVRQRRWRAHRKDKANSTRLSLPPTNQEQPVNHLFELPRFD